MSYQFQQPLEIADFSGGITDNYIDCPPTQYQKGDNFLIEKNRKLLSRSGLVIYDSSATRITGNTRIGHMINHPGDELWFQTVTKLYRITGGAFSELQGPVDSNPFMAATAVTDYVSSSQWKNHVYSVSTAFDNPKKTYKDSGGTWRLRNAGLPNIEQQGAIALANDIRTEYIAHIADAAEHTTADTTNTISAAAAHDFDSLITLVTELLTDFNAHEADDDAGAGSFHQAAEAGDATLTSTTAPTTVAECLTLLDDLKSKYNTHDADATSHTTGGTHAVSVVRVPAIANAGADTFIYTFHYKYEYTVGDVTFQDLSSVVQVTQGSLASGTKAISSIPVIGNGTNQCWDTGTITVEIYRTVNNGTTSYYVGSVTNGTTTFSDTVSDANIVTNPVLYTDGGVLEYDQPPPAKYVVVVNDIAWYAHIKEGTDTYPTRFRPSVKGNPDGAPASFSEDVETDITGIASVGIYPIVFSRNAVYRVEGFYDELGRGNIEKREISREKGCISNNGIVNIPATGFSPAGVVFPGRDGFYFSDGYDVRQISTHIIPTYENCVSSAANELKFTGRYDAQNNRVYWSCFDDSVTPNDTDNNRMFILDLNFQPTRETEWVFTTFSTDSGTWGASAFAFYDNVLVISDYRGYVFKFDENTLTDPKVDTSTAVANWDTKAIVWDYRGFATTFGTTAVFKFIPSITLQAKNQGNVSIQIKSNNEDSGNFRSLKEIRLRSGITWGDPNVIWGDDTFDYEWNTSKIIRTLRLFPTGHLRCIYKQIQITNSDTIIYNSDTFGLGTSDNSASTLTLNDGTQVLPTDIVGYYVAFDSDNYTNTFEITSRDSATQLTFSDTSILAPDDSTAKWIIRGTRKDEQLNLLSYAINFAPVYQHQDVYRGNTGGNA